MICACPEDIHSPPSPAQKRLEFPGGRGFSKAKTFKEIDQAYWNTPFFQCQLLSLVGVKFDLCNELMWPFLAQWSLFAPRSEWSWEIFAFEKWPISRCVGGLGKYPSVGEVWIFSGTTHFWLVYLRTKTSYLIMDYNGLKRTKDDLDRKVLRWTTTTPFVTKLFQVLCR